MIEIESFALRAAILHECQNYLGGGGGGGLGESEKNRDNRKKDSIDSINNRFSIFLASPPPPEL